MPTYDLDKPLIIPLNIYATPTYKNILAVFLFIVISSESGKEAVINLWNIPNSKPITIPVDINNENKYFISFFLNLSLIQSS